MSFFRRQGKKILLLHTYRTPEGNVRQRRLHAFADEDALRLAVEAESWLGLQVTLEQRWPDLALNFDQLREEAQMLVGDSRPSEVPVAQRTQLLRAALQDALSKLQQERDPDVLRSSGRELNAILVAGALRLDELRGNVGESLQDRFASRHRWSQFFVPNEQAEAAVEAAREAFEAGETERARACFEKARKLDPFDPDILISEGICHFHRGDYAAAEALYERARELAWHQLPLGRRTFDWGELAARPYVRATFNLGLVREEQWRILDAIELYRDCLRRCSNCAPPARLRLAELLHRQGRLEEALSEYAKVFSEPCRLFNQAAAWLSLGRPQDALPLLLEGLRQNPHMARFLLSKPRSATLPDLVGLDSPEYAEAYCRDCRALWTPAGLDFLRSVVTDPLVKKRLSGPTRRRLLSKSEVGALLERLTGQPA